MEGGKEKFKNIGLAIIGIAIIIGALLLAGLFIHGITWLSTKVFHWLHRLMGITIIVCILILLPLSIFRRTRGIAGNGMVLASYIFGLTLWIGGLLLTYTLWGIFAVFVGLFLLGIGVVPIAMLATLFKGMWSALGTLVSLTVLTFGTRAFGFYIIEKSLPKDYISL